MEGFPWDDLHKIFIERSQVPKAPKWRRNIAESLNRLIRAHKHYKRQMTDRRQTDGPTMTYSERELTANLNVSSRLLIRTK